ncbi:MAG: prephenate dehydratase [Bacillota bacterium]
MDQVLAYLGPEGTFTNQAACKSLTHLINPGSWEIKPFQTIPHILNAIEEGEISLGVVPAENSIEGSVNISLDMLMHEVNLHILGEIILDIEHHLLSHERCLEDIQTVMSHPQALAQCRHYLQRYLPHATIVQANSSADAVLYMAKQGKGWASIASQNAHEIYKIPILAANIGDYPKNQTRFFLVGKESGKYLSLPHTKTSLIMALERDRPGGLSEALGEFAREQINLSKIESRPTKKELGNYLFFIDCEAAIVESRLQRVLSNLSQKAALLKILGSYPRLS